MNSEGFWRVAEEAAKVVLSSLGFCVKELTREAK